MVYPQWERNALDYSQFFISNWIFLFLLTLKLFKIGEVGGGPSGLKNGSFQDNFWIGFEKKLLNLFHLILALGGNTLKIFHSTKKDMFSSLGHITLKGKINFDFKIENQKLPTEGGSMHLNAMGEI